MTTKDIFEFINANFTMQANVDCYNKLNCFVDAMRIGRYYPITDEEIHRGVEYKKTEGKAMLKYLGSIFPNEDQRPAEILIETLCNQSLQQFIDYKHKYEKQNNHVINSRNIY